MKQPSTQGLSWKKTPVNSISCTEVTHTYSPLADGRKGVQRNIVTSLHGPMLRETDLNLIWKYRNALNSHRTEGSGDENE